jgi:heme oxygenase
VVGDRAAVEHCEQSDQSEHCEQSDQSEQRSGFAVELRSQTRDQHEQLERVLDLPCRLGGPSDLAAILGVWGSLWAGVRSGCGAAGRDESARLLVSSVRAVRQVAVDLDDLAAVVAARPAVTRARRVAALRAAPDRCLVPVLGSPAGVWAVSYVLRGSRVGGTVLAPIIARHLGLPGGIADNYFGDSAAGPAWVRFRRRLDMWAHSVGESAREDVVRIAVDVFGMLGDRLDVALPPAALPPGDCGERSAQ